MNDQPTPRLYRGFRDVFASDLTARNLMIERVRAVYERYGFVPLETPTIEFVDILGKFLPESDQPDGGIFSLRNEDKEWIALRYDLTAPLSRVVAQYRELQKPFRRYQLGQVFRFEKPGPGRFREFYQFDFDSVGTESMAADAEACCIMCDTLEAVGIPRGQYIIKVNNRKILNGVLESVGVHESITQGKGIGEVSLSWVDVLRTIDKLDKVGLEGVRQLLTVGRKDPSGDFTPGLKLGDGAVSAIENYLATRGTTRAEVCDRLEEIVGHSAVGLEGVNEMRQIDTQLKAIDYLEDRVIFDPTVVRGLSYYTGPVFEGELTFEIKDEDGMVKRFGSVFGGGRYDNLVERFTGQKVPATGASIGVDRLLSALKALGRIEEKKTPAQVLVTTMMPSALPEYFRIAQELRENGINTELFMGKGGIRQQLKYADTLEIPLAVIAGEDEFASGQIQIKDLQLGRIMSGQVAERKQWVTERPAQIAVKRSQLVAEVKKMLDRVTDT